MITSPPDPNQATWYDPSPYTKGRIRIQILTHVSPDSFLAALRYLHGLESSLPQAGLHEFLVAHSTQNQVASHSRRGFCCLAW